MMLEPGHEYCSRIDRHGERCQYESVRFFVLDITSGEWVYGRCALHAVEEIRRYRVKEISADEIAVMEVHES
jgi:hypothetical protein